MFIIKMLKLQTSLYKSLCTIYLSLNLLLQNNLTAFGQGCDEGNWFQGYTSDADLHYEVFDTAPKYDNNCFAIGGRTTNARKYDPSMESENGAIILVYDSIGSGNTDTLVWAQVISKFNDMMITSVLAI